MEGLIGSRYIVYIYETVKEQMKGIPKREKDVIYMTNTKVRLERGGLLP